jgi:hypothetical protein
MLAGIATTCSLLPFFILCALGQQPQRSVLLPSSAARSIPDRPPSQGSWEPTKSDIESLETNLPQVAALNVKGWSPRIKIDHPEKYLRQYVAVIYGGKKLIFINAFCDDELPPFDWRDHLYVVTDGATCYWQALYNPATKKISSLTINSRG